MCVPMRVLLAQDELAMTVPPVAQVTVNFLPTTVQVMKMFSPPSTLAVWVGGASEMCGATEGERMEENDSLV